MKRNIIYSLGASILLAGAISAWKTIPASELQDAGLANEFALAEVPAVAEVPALPDEPALTRNPGLKEMPAEKKAAVTIPAASNLSYEAAFTDHVEGLYRELNLAQDGLNQGVFKKALTGFYNLKAKEKLSAEKEILTIVDFAKSSRDKRMWIIDLGQKKLLFNNLVAHGQGSGADKATRFSNTEASHQSSLGFYITGEVYYGKHGRSLRLDGMDSDFNSNARKRAIVLHGADYVSRSFINRVGRLGRSYGCPAVPESLSDSIIDKIHGKTVLFINGPDGKYSSDYLNVMAAARYLLPVNG